MVSHELRTPVAGVLGLPADDGRPLGRAQRRRSRLNTVRRAVTNARRLQAMTRDVLDTESIESGRIGYAFQRVDLGTELETAVSASRGVDALTLVTLLAPISRSPSRPIPTACSRCSRTCSRTPARTHPPTSRSSSRPSSSTTQPGDGCGSSVVDRGPGVSADSLERIFEKFVRGNDNAVTGTGLGLYIVRTIVDAHHGRIWCESDPGRRTAFVFELPLVDATVTASPMTAAAYCSRFGR